MNKKFFHTIKVFYEDTDVGGIVYYPNYLKYIERARTEALSEVGWSNTKISSEFENIIVVKSCNIVYKKPAFLEDILKIESFINTKSKTSLNMSQLIYKNDDLIAEAKIHLVFVNLKGKPVKIPEKIQIALKPYVSSISTK